jgi:hypothetical protein
LAHRLARRLPVPQVEWKALQFATSISATTPLTPTLGPILTRWKAPWSYAVLILHIMKEKALTLAQRFHRMSPEYKHYPNLHSQSLLAGNALQHSGSLCPCDTPRIPTLQTQRAEMHESRLRSDFELASGPTRWAPSQQSR